MRVFVAGASGAIGKPLIAALVAAKHSVVGMTTSSAGIARLRERGADGLVLNALDREAVEREIKRIRPDAVIDELTSLPKRYSVGYRTSGGRHRYRTTHRNVDGGGCGSYGS